MPRKGTPAPDHPLLDRLEQSRDGAEAGAAVGEGADPGQHDAVRAAHRLRVGRDGDRPAAPVSAAIRWKLFSAECRLPLE